MPHEPVTAIVVGKLCFCEIRSSTAGHAAMFHMRDNEWLHFSISNTLDRAVAAIADFLDRVWHLPPGWSQANDDAMRDAALAVLVGPADAALPLAA